MLKLRTANRLWAWCWIAAVVCFMFAILKFAYPNGFLPFAIDQNFFISASNVLGVMFIFIGIFPRVHSAQYRLLKRMRIYDGKQLDNSFHKNLMIDEVSN